MVDPPIAIRTVIALANAAGVRTCDGRRSARAISTARRPVSSAIAARLAWTAGIVAAPGSVIPSASVTQAIVDAVPISLQWPGEGIQAAEYIVPAP